MDNRHRARRPAGRLAILAAVTATGAAIAAVSSPAHAQTCAVATNALNHPPNSPGNAYHRIDTNGNIVACDGGCGATWTWYYSISPTSATNGMVDRAAYMQGSGPQMPAYLPFKDSTVRVTNGWMYNSSTRHAAMDYARGDGGKFSAYAVADGRVIWAGWMPSPGNVVIIEHTAPNGRVWRSIYHHLMNGRDNDIRLARATSKYFLAQSCLWPKDCDGDGKPDADATAWSNYQSEANAASLGDPSIADKWGRNSDTLLVSQGDTVRAGQRIGTAGATGKDQTGIHIHLMFARPALHRVNSVNTSRWTFYDPHGLYAELASCYQTEFPTGTLTNQHRTSYAPVFQDFVRLPTGSFQRAFDHFATFSFFPKTLATESFSGWFISGSFQRDTAGPVTRFLQTFDQYQNDANFWSQNGWWPWTTSTLASSSTATLYSAVYAPIRFSSFTSHKMSAAWFNQEFSDRYQNWELVEAEPYVEGGQLYFIGSWERRSHGAYGMYFALDITQLTQMQQQNDAAGIRIVKVNKYDHPGLGARYAAIWTASQTKPTTPVFDIAQTSFPLVREQWIAAGYHIKRITTYRNTYNVVFEKN